MTDPSTGLRLCVFAIVALLLASSVAWFAVPERLLQRPQQVDRAPVLQVTAVADRPVKPTAQPVVAPSGATTVAPAKAASVTSDVPANPLASLTPTADRGVADRVPTGDTAPMAYAVGGSDQAAVDPNDATEPGGQDAMADPSPEENGTLVRAAAPRGESPQPVSADTAFFVLTDAFEQAEGVYRLVPASLPIRNTIVASTSPVVAEPSLPEISDAPAPTGEMMPISDLPVPRPKIVKKRVAKPADGIGPQPASKASKKVITVASQMPLPTSQTPTSQASTSQASTAPTPSSGFQSLFGATQKPAPASTKSGTSGIGMASYYGKELNGRRTANGEVFDMHALTAAHRSLPFGTKVKVTNLANGKSVVLRVADRGPFIKGRVIDVSYAAAKELGFVQNGVAKVRIDTVL